MVVLEKCVAVYNSRQIPKIRQYTSEAFEMGGQFPIHFYACPLLKRDNCQQFFTTGIRNDFWSCPTTLKKLPTPLCISAVLRKNYCF